MDGVVSKTPSLAGNLDELRCLERLFVAVIREQRPAARLSAASLRAVRRHVGQVAEPDRLEYAICTRVPVIENGEEDWLVLRTDPAGMEGGEIALDLDLGEGLIDAA
jgi:hypothetical protein